MKTMKYTSLLFAALLAGACCISCDDACEYEDTKTSNPTFGTEHPESLANTFWVRTGIKKNAYGEEVQGFVESMDFITADSVIVKMSEGATAGTWTDDSNTDKVPAYEYTYSDVTGKLEVLKTIVDEKGKVSKSSLFTGIANSGKKNVLTIAHYGDTPVQSYLVKQW